MKQHKIMKQKIYSIIQQLHTYRREESTRLDTLLESLKRTVNRALDKICKKIQNELNQNFELMILRLKQRYQQLDSPKTNPQEKVNQLYCTYRYAKKIEIESERVCSKKTEENLNKFCKTFCDNIKNQYIPIKINLDYTDSSRLELKKTFPFNQIVQKVEFINNKAMYQGDYFYKIEGRAPEKFPEKIINSKIIRINNQDVLLICYDSNKIKIRDEKDNKIVNLSLDLTDLLQIVQLQDYLYFVKKKQIIRFDLHYSDMKIKNILQKQAIQQCAPNIYEGCLIVFINNQICWYNSDMELIQTKKINYLVKQILVAQDRLILLSENGINIYWKDQQARQQKPNLSCICLLNSGEILLLGKDNYIYSLNQLKCRSIKSGKEQVKKKMIHCISNNYEVYICYENNTVKIFQIE